jgi:hypothetical protein
MWEGRVSLNLTRSDEMCRWGPWDGCREDKIGEAYDIKQVAWEGEEGAGGGGRGEEGAGGGGRGEEGAGGGGRGGMSAPILWRMRVWDSIVITWQEGRSRKRSGEGTTPSKYGNWRSGVAGAERIPSSNPRLRMTEPWREKRERNWEKGGRRVKYHVTPFPYSLTRSGLHIPHTNSVVPKSWHDPTTIRRGTDTRDPLMTNGREESEGMKQKGDRIKQEEEEEEEEWEITHLFMAFQHSLTRSRLHIPHTNSLVPRSWHDPTTIRQGTDTHDPLVKNGRKRREREGSEGMKQNQRGGWRGGRMGDHSPLHGLPTLAHKIPSPDPTHEQSCHQILTRPDDHQARHRHSWPPNEEWKEEKRREWGNETERRQNQRRTWRMGDHSHLHGLPTLAHKIRSPDPTHEQSCHEILTRPDDHQTRHRHSWPPNEEWKRREGRGVREWNRKETESKRKREKKNGRSLTFPWPSNTRSQDPVSTSHTRTVLSQDPDTTRRPSGKAQTLVTP